MSNNTGICPNCDSYSLEEDGSCKICGREPSGLHHKLLDIDFINSLSDHSNLCEECNENEATQPSGMCANCHYLNFGDE